jgi:hypothetical protein
LHLPAGDAARILGPLQDFGGLFAGFGGACGKDFVDALWVRG